MTSLGGTIAVCIFIKSIETTNFMNKISKKMTWLQMLFKNKAKSTFNHLIKKNFLCLFLKKVKAN